MAEYGPRICFDRPLPPEKALEAARRAIAENPANLPIGLPMLGFGVSASEPLRMAIFTQKKWRNGRTLKVGFMGGSTTVQNKVKEYARKWSDFANIQFDFVPSGPADIRVALVLGDGSWSYLGTDALTIPADQPTMNYGWLTPESPEEEFSRVILHEFGHALGCIHEHQHPEAGIPWDREAVYARYGAPPNNWPREVVDSNLFATYGRDQTQFSQFDRQSIMLYAIPNELTTGDFEVGWNTALSGTDKEFIGKAYPRAADEVPVLRPGASPVEAAIGEPGEEDRYRFLVESPGRFILGTQGNTDVVMALFGPDSQARLVAEDDDSGPGLNPKIVRQLQPGTYHVRVRHFGRTRTGNYRIALNSG